MDRIHRSKQARVLIVSASHYTRYIISGELSSEPDLFVVGTARTPDEIAYKQAMLRPHLTVVELESSRDLSDLRQTLAQLQLPVLALCSHTEEGANLAFAALEAGATDIVAKLNSSLGAPNFAPDLLNRVRGLARIKPRRMAWRWPGSPSCSKASPRRFFPGDRLVAVSASTGGLEPLIQILTALPADLDASLLALTSLPTYYLHWFIRRISPSTAFHLRLARDGLPLDSGVVYFAPHDHHLITGMRGYLALQRGPRRKGIRSSADVTLSSLASHYGPTVIGVILSGIGHDGVQGALDVRAAGGTIIVQETLTCLADETPTAVIESGATTVMLPPEQIADEIVRLTKAQH